jgi:hypothetical protein
MENNSEMPTPSAIFATILKLTDKEQRELANMLEVS